MPFDKTCFRTFFPLNDSLQQKQDDASLLSGFHVERKNKTKTKVRKNQSREKIK